MASNSNSGQKFISRNRKPRVHITYEDPYDAERLVELPFVMGVLADLSGNSSEVEKPNMADRGFLDIDMDNFEKRMAAIEPGISMKVANKLGDESGEKLSVKLKLKSIEDFSPAKVARQIPATAKLLQAREQLSNLLRYMDGKVGAEDTLKKLLADPQLMAALKNKMVEKPSTEDSAE
jgi:type VI secretion system protein ImpB